MRAAGAAAQLQAVGRTEGIGRIMANELTPEAKSLWAAIPAEQQSSLLQNVWCPSCGRPTKIVNFQGRIQHGDLVLEGECESCGSPVGRLIETA